MLGLSSANVVAHLFGEEEIDLSTGGRGLSLCCAIEEGFLRSTFRDDFPLSSGGSDSALGAVLLTALPNPNLDPVPALACGSTFGRELGEGSRKFGLGSPVCNCLLTAG